MPEAPQAVVFDIGRVLYDWNLRHLFEKLIADPTDLDRFLAEVVTEEWHFESDRGARSPRWCPSESRSSPIAAR